MSGFMALLDLSTSRPNGSPGPSTVQRTHRAANSTPKHDFSHLRVGAERRQAAAEVERLRGLTPEQQLSDGGLSASRMSAAVAKTGRDRRF